MFNPQRRRVVSFDSDLIRGSPQKRLLETVILPRYGTLQSGARVRVMWNSSASRRSQVLRSQLYTTNLHRRCSPINGQLDSRRCFSCCGTSTPCPRPSPAASWPETRFGFWVMPKRASNCFAKREQCSKRISRLSKRTKTQVRRSLPEARISLQCSETNGSSRRTQAGLPRLTGGI